MIHFNQSERSLQHISQEKKTRWDNFWDTQPKFKRHILIFCFITVCSIVIATLGADIAGEADTNRLLYDDNTSDGTFEGWCGAAGCINQCTELLFAYQKANKTFADNLPWIALGTALVCSTVIMLLHLLFEGCQKKTRTSAYQPIAQSANNEFAPERDHAISSRQSFKECLSPNNVKLRALTFIHDHHNIVNILHLSGVTAFTTFLARVSTGISGAIVNNDFAIDFPEGICVPSNTTHCIAHCASVLRKADQTYDHGVGYGLVTLIILSIVATLIQLAIAGTFSAVPTLIKSAWNKCTGKENLPEEGGMPRATTKLTAPNNHRSWLCC